ncbi:hypothetical protein M1N23_04065 [Dehalococcoidia bacterium]|nr:hypothetical protein [Dehalococcoidia bacterium]
MLTGIKHTAVVLLGCLLLMLVLAACGGTSLPTPAPTPNIEAIVEARVAEERSKKAEAASIAMIEATVQAILLSDQGHIAFASNRDGNEEIYVMNADGSGQTRLTNNAGGDNWPAWSPDGAKIAFQSKRDGNYSRHEKGL